jgi:hypothetical protein
MKYFIVMGRLMVGHVRSVDMYLGLLTSIYCRSVDMYLGSLTSIYWTIVKVSYKSVIINCVIVFCRFLGGNVRSWNY